MAKYCFKVYCEDGDNRRMIPSSMQQTDLADMDRFANEQGSYFQLCEALAKELNIIPENIQKITILRIKKENEFSVIVGNPYLSPVLSSLEIKRMQGYGNYQIEVTAVSTSHPSYIEMKNYLLANLQTNYQNFLENIYTYSNEFSKLLYRYGSTYQQGLFIEEDARNIKELEERIIAELSIYKNYRGLCRARKKYEERTIYGTITNKNSNVKNLQVPNHSKIIPNYTLERKFLSLEKQVEMYNQEYEEFLDADEYQEMLDDFSDKNYK